MRRLLDQNLQETCESLQCRSDGGRSLPRPGKKIGEGIPVEEISVISQLAGCKFLEETLCGHTVLLFKALYGPPVKGHGVCAQTVFPLQRSLEFVGLFHKELIVEKEEQVKRSSSISNVKLAR